jgi:hypothetical protein
MLTATSTVSCIMLIFFVLAITSSPVGRIAGAQVSVALCALRRVSQHGKRPAVTPDSTGTMTESHSESAHHLFPKCTSSMAR